MSQERVLLIVVYTVGVVVGILIHKVLDWGEGQ